MPHIEGESHTFLGGEQSALLVFLEELPDINEQSPLELLDLDLLLLAQVKCDGLHVVWFSLGCAILGRGIGISRRVLGRWRPFPLSFAIGIGVVVVFVAASVPS